MTSSRRILSIVLIAMGLSINEVNAVYGGTPALSNEFTFAVRIVLKGERGMIFCGGTIIDPRHILTAAHCLVNQTNAAILSGVRNRSDTDNGIVTHVEKIIPHPGYKRGEVGRDIGILVLKEALKLGGRQNAIPLPTKFAGYDVYATFAGWGGTSEEDSLFPMILQKASVKLLGCSWCHGNGKIPFCICGTHESSSFCSGDSGSGLVANGTIIGTAMASPCANGSTDYYTSVYYNLNWIKSIINENKLMHNHR